MAWGSTRDWGYFTFLEEVTRKTILEFRQFPLWNPYYFGGAEQLANPQSTLLSPTTLLTLGFGTALGLKFGVVAFVLLGLTGMYRLTRHLGAARGSRRERAHVRLLPGGSLSTWAEVTGIRRRPALPLGRVAFPQGHRDPGRFLVAVALCAWVAVHWGIYTLPLAVRDPAVSRWGKRFAAAAWRRWRCTPDWRSQPPGRDGCGCCPCWRT